MRMTRKTNSVVRKRITSAMFELMAEKPLDEISISELAERAQVARVSFYRNFEGKEDVLRGHAQAATEDFLDRVGPDLLHRDPHAFVLEFLRHMHDRRDFVALYMASSRMDIVREEFNRAFGVGCADRRQSARRAFLAGGLYNLSYRWALSDYDPPAEVLAEFVYTLMPPGERETGPGTA